MGLNDLEIISLLVTCHYQLSPQPQLQPQLQPQQPQGPQQLQQLQQQPQQQCVGIT